MDCYVSQHSKHNKEPMGHNGECKQQNEYS